jgi:capsular exopolysaccharide synthesis family protein
MQEFSSDEISLLDILRVIFSHKIIIFTMFIIVMLSVYIGLELRTPMYQSSVRMLVAGTMQKDLEYQRELGPGSLIQTHMNLVKSRPIIERTVKALKLYQIPIDYERKFTTRLNAQYIDYKTKKIKKNLEKMTDENRKAFLYNRAMSRLQGNISTHRVQEASIFAISVKDFSPVGAAIIANALSRSYVIFDLEQQIAELRLIYGEKNSTIIKLKKHIEHLKESLDGRILPDIEAIGPASVKIVSQAGLGAPIEMTPSKPSALMIGFIMSVVSSLILSFLFDYFNQTFRSPKDVRRYLNMPILGSIPKRKLKDKNIMINTNPKTTIYTRSIVNLTNTLYLLNKEHNYKSFLLADAESSKFTSKTIADLGICLSQNTAQKILIIDANFKMQKIPKIFNISPNPGLSEILKGDISFEEAVKVLNSNLSVLPAGDMSMNSKIALLESDKMSEVMEKAKKHYNIVIIHCSDLRNFTDVAIVSNFVDGIILIINEGKVKRHIVKNTIAPLLNKKVNIMGVILNNRKFVIPKLFYKLT